MKLFRILGINFMPREIFSFINLCRNLICCSMEWTLTSWERHTLEISLCITEIAGTILIYKSNWFSFLYSLWLFFFLLAVPNILFTFITCSSLSLFCSLLDVCILAIFSQYTVCNHYIIFCSYLYLLHLSLSVHTNFLQLLWLSYCYRSLIF